MTEVTCVLDAKATLGESPVWSARENALYWVDIPAPALHRLDLASGNLKTWRMPETIGCLGLRAKGGAVVALRNGFHFFDFDSGRLTAVSDPEGKRHCTACFSGRYPVAVNHTEDQLALFDKVRG